MNATLTLCLLVALCFLNSLFPPVEVADMLFGLQIHFLNEGGLPFNVVFFICLNFDLLYAVVICCSDSTFI